MPRNSSYCRLFELLQLKIKLTALVPLNPKGNEGPKEIIKILKMRNSVFLIIILSILSIPGQSQTYRDTSEEVGRAIQQNFQQKGAAMAAGNAQELSRYFMEGTMEDRSG